MTSIRDEEYYRNPSLRQAAELTSFPPTSTAANIAGQQTVVTWWAFTETSGISPATFQVFDGNDATGQEVATITLLPNESIREGTGDRGLYLERGPFVNVLSGSVKGTFAMVDK